MSLGTGNTAYIGRGVLLSTMEIQLFMSNHKTINNIKNIFYLKATLSRENNGKQKERLFT